MFGGDGFYYLLALFGFEGTGGVDEAAAGGEVLEGSGEDGALALGLTGQFFGLEAESDLGVTGEGAGAGARNIAEDEVEEVVAREGDCVGDCASNITCIGIAAEPCLEAGEALCAYVGRKYVRVGEAVGEDEGLAAGGGAAVPDFLSVWLSRGSKLGYEMGAVVHVRKVLRGIGAEHCAFGWLLLVGFTDFESGVAAIGVCPALYEPTGMGQALGKGCD